MDQKRNFIITGVGRSGTGYISKLLRQLNITCGHENVFRPETIKPDFSNFEGDASWLAAPYIQKLPSNTVVLHQIRHPVMVAKSFIGIGFFDQNPTNDHAPYLKFLNQFSRFDMLQSREERFMFHWINWNKYIEQQVEKTEHHYFRYKLEDLTPDGICELVLKPIGVERTINDVELAQKEIGTTTNRRTRDLFINRTSLSAYAIFTEFEAAAEKYGYILKDQ